LFGAFSEQSHDHSLQEKYEMPHKSSLSYHAVQSKQSAVCNEQPPHSMKHSSHRGLAYALTLMDPPISNAAMNNRDHDFFFVNIGLLLGPA
jgi:hypothetical protein